MCLHVAPPSFERNTPLPSYESTEPFDSPVPHHTVFGSLGSSASAPTDEMGARSVTHDQFTPKLVDFHTPPSAAPRYTVAPPGSATIAVTRPPTLNGPTGVHGTPALVISDCDRSNAGLFVRREPGVLRGTGRRKFARCA